MRNLVCLFLVWAVLAAGTQLADAQDMAAQNQRVLQHPAAFLEAAAAVTHWFGDPRGVDASGVADFVAARRASYRANAMALILQADLSGDGAVDAAEVARLAPGLAPGLRGKLIAAVGRADLNADGQVSSDELHLFAGTEALRLFPDQKLQDVKTILLFDRNGDAWVTYDEVVLTLNDLAAQQATAQAQAKLDCTGASCDTARRGRVKPRLPRPATSTTSRGAV